MLTQLSSWITGSLRVKVMVSIASTVIVLMGIVTYVTISNSTRVLLQKVEHFGLDLAKNTYSGIKHPMAMGDSLTVQQQLHDIRTQTKGVEVYICDYNQEIVYASNEENLKANASDIIANEESLKVLKTTLRTGDAPQKGFVEHLQKGRYMTMFLPLLNQKECYHCHGSSRKVLGSLIVRQSVNKDYATIASTRNLIILFSLIGILAVIFLLNLLIFRFVTTPVREVANKAQRVAGGDTSVTANVDSKDSIGRLAKNFNLMVKNINDKMEYANSLKLGISLPFFMVDPSMTITYLNEAGSKLCGYSREEVEGKMKCSDVFKSTMCENKCPMTACLETGESTEDLRLQVTSREGKEIPILTSIAALRDSTGKILGGFEIWRDITKDLESERLLKEAAEKEEDQRRYLERRVDSFTKTLDKAAEGDLSQLAETTEKNDAMDTLAKKTNEMFKRIGHLIHQAKITATAVVGGSKEISSGNQDLALRTQQQAATVEETSATLEQISTSITSTAASTVKADNLAKEAVSMAREGKNVLAKTIDSVTEVAVTSKRIEEIMDLVTEITFQTKLLALNAAVEAARAGEHGKGFSVVANEVRMLAKRSAEAGKDIQVLVKDSMHKVETAHQLVNQTGSSLKKIIEHIESLSESISEISSATQDESNGIEQINMAMTEIGDVVEHNATLVEELAAASEQLTTKAEILKSQTDDFILGEEGQSCPIVTGATEIVKLPVQKERRGSIPPVKKSLRDDLIRKGEITEEPEEDFDDHEMDGFEEF
jgi:PAS domain S-box-containing protein